jgi:TolA protein
VHVAEKPKPPEPKPPPKPEPKPEAQKAEPPKREPPKPEPTKTASAKPPVSKPETHAAAKPETTGKAGVPAGKETRDDYAAAAERWRTRAGKGGGLGGADTGSGPIGSGGQGPGGGGQLVGLEFMAYRQQVINTVKARWTNFSRPGLVVTISFEIGPEGDVGAVRVERSSGDAAYDASAVRAVQRATPLPPPPARYAREFHEFQIEFHSEEQGGQGAG